jgi:PAS domain S-box-containing protein
MRQELSATASDEASFVIGPFGTIEDADNAACALLGYSKAELVGLHGSDLIPQAQRPAVAVTLDRMRHGDLRFAASAMKRRDGSVVRVEVCARRLCNNRLGLTVRPKRTERSN